MFNFCLRAGERRGKQTTNATTLLNTSPEGLVVARNGLGVRCNRAPMLPVVATGRAVALPLPSGLGRRLIRIQLFSAMISWRVEHGRNDTVNEDQKGEF